MGDQHVTLRPLSNQRKLRYPMSTMKSSLSIGCMMGLVWLGVGMCKCRGDISDIRESLRKDGPSWKPRCGLDSGAETKRL